MLSVCIFILHIYWLGEMVVNSSVFVEISAFTHCSNTISLTCLVDFAPSMYSRRTRVICGLLRPTSCAEGLALGIEPPLCRWPCPQHRQPPGQTAVSGLAGPTCPTPMAERAMPEAKAYADGTHGGTLTAAVGRGYADSILACAEGWWPSAPRGIPVVVVSGTLMLVLVVSRQVSFTFWSLHVKTWWCTWLAPL